MVNMAKGWERAGGEMFLQNAKETFLHRGVQCWTKRIKNGPWLGTHLGYFRMTIPGIKNQHDLTDLFVNNGGKAYLPNGGRFTYLVRVDNHQEYVAGFDGMHAHNTKTPLSNEDARAQIIAAIDFLLDNNLGSLAFIPAQA